MNESTPKKTVVFLGRTHTLWLWAAFEYYFRENGWEVIKISELPLTDVSIDALIVYGYGDKFVEDYKGITNPPKTYWMCIPGIDIFPKNNGVTMLPVGFITPRELYNTVIGIEEV